MDLTSRKGRLNRCCIHCYWSCFTKSIRFIDHPAMAKSLKIPSCIWYPCLKIKQNCRLGVDRCSHPGCSEAKLMYLHHKTCSAQLVGPCPTQHKGCQDARKLLAHYRRCRDIRARQSQNPSGKNRQQHVCLVCSLVARHAKFTLDKCSPASKNGTTSHLC